MRPEGRSRRARPRPQPVAHQVQRLPARQVTRLSARQGASPAAHPAERTPALGPARGHPDQGWCSLVRRAKRAGPKDASVPASASLPATASTVLLLSTATRPSVPPSMSRTHFQSAVHVYPFWHSSWGEHTLQSRTTQESPDVAGTRSASTPEHTTCRFLMSEVLGWRLRKLRRK